MSGLILWANNLGLIWEIITEPALSLWDKVTFFTSAYEGLFTAFGNIQAVSIIIVSILFGINLALLVFVLKHRGFNEVPKKSGVFGFFFAIFAGGCAACGTSVVYSVLIALGATAGPFFKDLILVFNWIASVLIVYSIYKLGAICSYIFATNKK
ncbi:MAG: hypothetical protein M3P98_02430 [bacterium]|nr:hypothetical protein [bacterium]